MTKIRVAWLTEELADEIDLLATNDPELAASWDAARESFSCKDRRKARIALGMRLFRHPEIFLRYLEQLYQQGPAHQSIARKIIAETILQAPEEALLAFGLDRWFSLVADYRVHVDSPRLPERLLGLYWRFPAQRPSGNLLSFLLRCPPHPDCGATWWLLRSQAGWALPAEFSDLDASLLQASVSPPAYLPDEELARLKQWCAEHLRARLGEVACQFTLAQLESIFAARDSLRLTESELRQLLQLEKKLYTLAAQELASGCAADDPLSSFSMRRHIWENLSQFNLMREAAFTWLRSLPLSQLTQDLIRRTSPSKKQRAAVLEILLESHPESPLVETKNLPVDPGSPNRPKKEHILYFATPQVAAKLLIRKVATLYHRDEVASLVPWLHPKSHGDGFLVAACSPDQAPPETIITEQFNALLGRADALAVKLKG